MDINKLIHDNEFLNREFNYRKHNIEFHRLNLLVHKDLATKYVNNNLFIDETFKVLTKNVYRSIHEFGSIVFNDSSKFSKDFNVSPFNQLNSDHLVPIMNNNFKNNLKTFRKPFCPSPKNGFPCGKCLYCLERKRRPWIARLTEERKYWHRVGVSTFFITLTYNDENLPDGVCKEHLQKFFKKLRQSYKQYGDNSLKYFAVSEYGTLTHRPHYHIILFGFNQSLNVLARIVSQNWQYGFNQISLVKSNRINYVTKYSVKLSDDEFTPPVPEFRLISKGIGLKFLDARQVRHFVNHPDKLFMTCDGVKYSLPRYYRDKIFGDNLIVKSKFLFESIERHLRFLDFYTSSILSFDIMRYVNNLPSFFQEVYNKDLEGYNQYIKKHKNKV